VLAGGRLADLELAGNQDAADAIFHQISINLGWKVADRVPKPAQDLQTLVIGQRSENGFGFHSTRSEYRMDN